MTALLFFAAFVLFTYAGWAARDLARLPVDDRVTDCRDRRSA